MGMGSDTSAGGAQQATGLGGATGAMGGGGGGLGSIMGLLGGLLGSGGSGGAGVDPAVIKSLGSAASSIGGSLAAIDKVPPHAKEMIKQAINEAQRKTQMQQQDQLNPYGGDMMQYITPDMARGVLDAHGIPYGRMNIG